MAVAERPTEVTGVRRRWAALGAAAFVWFVLYRLNEPFWEWLLYDTIGLDADTRLAESAHFFFYDVTKIALLLTSVIFVVRVLRSFMSVERTRALVGGRREGVGNVFAAGVLPSVEALHDNGLPMGTVLAFMMSVVALSTPEVILLRRVLKKQLIATYVGVVAVGILATGYLFNLII